MNSFIKILTGIVFILIPIIGSIFPLFSNLLNFESLSYFIIGVGLIILPNNFFNNLTRLKVGDLEIESELDKINENIEKTNSTQKEEVKKIKINFSNEKDPINILYDEVKTYSDINMAIFRISIEIDKKLKELAQEGFIAEEWNTNTNKNNKVSFHLLRFLYKQNVLDNELFQSLVSYRNLRNKIVHGDFVEYSYDLIEVGIKLLRALNYKLALYKYANQNLKP